MKITRVEALRIRKPEFDAFEWWSTDYRDGDTFLSELFIGDAVAQNGFFTLSDKPGMSVELNEPVVAEYLLPRD